MEIVVAITGASGVVIGARPAGGAGQAGRAPGAPARLEGAEAVIAHEIGADVPLPATYRWQPDDLAAPIASSSRAPEAMVVAPCSMKTLVGHRPRLCQRSDRAHRRDHAAADRPLVLMPRETPLSLPAIENMRLAKLAGAIILPPVVAYYPHPQTVDDVTDFFVGKVLDVLGLEHDLYRRWGDEPWICAISWPGLAARAS